jgi:putative membrane protein
VAKLRKYAGETAATVPRGPLAAIERQSRDVRDSAHDVQQASEHVESSAEHSTRLAADRTVLAAERTYAAWVRTGLFALASGIGARAMLTGLMPGWLIAADSLALIAFSVFCFAAAVWRELRPGAPPPEPRVRALPPAMLIVLNVFLALVSIAAGGGIWTGSVGK